MDAPEATSALGELERQLSGLSLRGQWQADPNRPQKRLRRPNGALGTEPVPAGKLHVWRWHQIEPLLATACAAMPESYTARRALVYANPGLARGTTHTLLASLQVIQPGETAWAHRHTINAVRFVIRGSRDLSTVVDGRALAMEPYDLILTPGGSWHDHHNESDAQALWLDVLDVPFTLALNQNFYDELGEVSQEVVEKGDGFQAAARIPSPASAPPDRPSRLPWRYPWSEMREVVRQRAAGMAERHDGHLVEYADPGSGGSVLPTFSCAVQQLPPGFRGTARRRTASAICFVMEGRGTIEGDDGTVAFEQGDLIAIPNWMFVTWRNLSDDAPVTLFRISDAPILHAFGYYREQDGE